MQRISFTSWRRVQVSCVLLALLFVGCEPPGKPNPANRPEMPDKVLDFKALYTTNCAGCHGADGNLGPAPPLNDPLFMAIVPDDILLNVIRAGRAGTPMPPFSKDHGGPLTLEQIKVIADGIKSNWKSDKPAPKPIPQYAITKLEGAQSPAASPERGAEVFSRACATCHGPNGVGNDENGIVTNAINVPAFLALISDQAIRRIIITGRPDLGMPNYHELDGRPDNFQPLTSAEIDDVVALLASWRTTAKKIARSSP